MRKAVGIDTRMAGHSGIGTYLRNLLANIEHGPDLELRLFGLPHDQRGLAAGFTIEEFKSPIYGFSEQFNYLSLSKKVDLWHAPHYNAPYLCGSRLVVTVHDVIPYIFAGSIFSVIQKIYIERMMLRLRETANRIITVSEHTRNDLVRLFGFEPGKISVIHQGVNGEFSVPVSASSREALRAKYGLPETPYVLYVGLLKPHKNLRVLIEAVRKIRMRGRRPEKLVIVGKKDASYPPEFKYLEEIRTDDDILYIPKADYGDLPGLYQMASMLVCPSLYEGFGLPVVEAFASGTPVIASNRASLPEVAADAAAFFEAESVEDLAASILKLLEDAAYRDVLRTRGLTRMKRFQWGSTARETMKVYREVLAE